MSVYTLPPDLPAPVDDGACDHLTGLAVPELTLDSSQGPVDLAKLGAGRAVDGDHQRIHRDVTRSRNSM